MSTQDKRYNLVSFLVDGSASNGGTPLRLMLSLEDAWRVDAGLKPNVNRAIVPYTEFDKLAQNVDRTGSIEFWYTHVPAGVGDFDPNDVGAPDVVLKGWRIVDVEAAEIGVVYRTSVTRIVEYRLYFADFREQFVSPRGGRVLLGLINKGPKPQTQGTAGGITASSPDNPGGPDNTGATPAAPSVPEMTLSELIGECLDAMGQENDVPAAVDGVDAPRDLKWFGNHAPTELAKLLEVAGAVFCPLSSGAGSVQMVQTSGGSVVQAEPNGALPTLTVPSIDRRGRTVIFSSYPFPVVETMVLQGPQDDQFYFVIQDSKGNWVKQDTADLVTQGEGSMLDCWKDQFAAVPSQYRQRVAFQAYRFIQLGNGSNPPAGSPSLPLPPAGQMPVLNQRIESDGSLQDIEINAKVAQWDPTKLQYINSDGNVRIAATFKSDGNVIQLAVPLIQVTGPTNDRFNDAQELKAGDFTVRFSVPQYTQQPDGTWIPRFLHLGFTRAVGKVVQLSDSEVAVALADGTANKDVIIVPRPDLRLRIVQDSPRNLDQITKAAAALADKYLANSGQPTLLNVCRGFAKAEINGTISSIEYDQEKVQTTVTQCNWYRPAGALDATTLLKRELGTQGYPEQGTTEETRQALGEPGATLPMQPLSPAAAPELGGVGGTIVQIGSPRANGAGFYDGTLYSGRLKTDGTADLSLPGNLTQGQSCEVFNVDESIDQGAATKTHRLKKGSWANVVFMDRTNNTADQGEESNAEPLAVIRGGIGDDSFVTPIDPPGSQTTADNSTWTRGQAPKVAGDGAGAVIYLSTRPWVDGTTNSIGYMQRKFTFDGNGCLISYGPEEKVTLDTGTTC